MKKGYSNKMAFTQSKSDKKKNKNRPVAIRAQDGKAKIKGGR